MKTLTCYCGASDKVADRFKDAALALGGAMANNDFRLVYGGGSRGLMGAVADGVLRHNGHVIGVIPERLKNIERQHDGTSELITTISMSERKVIMEQHADAYVALAGGIGTLDELFQVMADRQLGYHQKPIALLNTAGYFDTLLTMLDDYRHLGFVPASSINTLIIESDPEALINQLKRQLA